MGGLCFLPGPHALAQPDGWQRKPAAHVSAGGGFLAPLVSQRDIFGHSAVGRRIDRGVRVSQEER